ncbi:hypothetical protein O181_080239 [Austropuccinia psidii MF-1]|uniref:Uncharacterized protein n=1 Tax=Austropuccinia psidii MF-1 TaxID=1389203 RepID=A0A9Q3FK04_9BASI|nr:hypothetical protein [Austropuccinia psidii MF-1]
MPIQHSPTARKTRSQAGTQAFLTPTSRAPLDGIAAVPQLRAHLHRGPNLEGAALSRKEGRVPRKIKLILRSSCKIPRTFKGHSQRSR